MIGWDKLTKNMMACRVAEQLIKLILAPTPSPRSCCPNLDTSQALARYLAEGEPRDEDGDSVVTDSSVDYAAQEEEPGVEVQQGEFEGWRGHVSVCCLHSG